MTLRRHTFEGATVGSAITGTESGSGDNLNVVSATGGGSIIGSSGPGGSSMHGTKCAAVTPTSGNQAMVAFTGMSTNNLASRAYHYFGTVPTTDFHLIRHQVSGTRVASSHINSASKLRLDDATGVTGIWTATANTPGNSWVRTDLLSIVGTTTANGSLKTAQFLGDSTTAISGIDSTTGTGAVTPGTQNVGTTPLTTAVLGKGDSGSYATLFYLDDVACNDAATNYVSTNSAPVATAGAAQAVAVSTAFSLPWTATDADGDTLTYTATADGGNPASLGTLVVGGTAPNKTVTGTAPATPGKYLVNVKANDGTADSNTAVLTLYVTSTTSTPSATVGATNWVPSTSTIAACLADALDSTYAESPGNPTTEQVTVQLTPFPASATSATIGYRFAQDVSSPARSLTVTLYDQAGGTAIAGKTEATITTSIVAGSLALTSGQLAAWTTRNESVLTFEAN